MPISLAQLKSIRAMLGAGFRHTQIARELDLSFGTISRLADDRKLRDTDVADEDLALPDDDPPPGYQAKNLRRCPTCGAMVYLWPCLACRMKAQARPLPEHESFHARPQAPAPGGVALSNTVAFGSPLNESVTIHSQRCSHAQPQPRS
jgi:hypothetical protein